MYKIIAFKNEEQEVTNYLTFFTENLFVFLSIYLIEKYSHGIIKYNNLIYFQIQMPKLPNSQAPGFQSINYS